ncbi:hypothetical protein [Piscinibacter gummiphilus]|uniref:Uncharacterized protein n=1 Tax=Piscinibacter gummiphilus TaxID=946333 RepID=A0ABZ0CMV7_9BURK|nr:hypothetical protein [Piscinibacter gummiphilus]WOB06219.1 hypothetical protein RXV79_14930 [Piscinibacter gummiphilus]
MGVVREYAECTVCGSKLILRVGVSVENSCTHTFDCPNCHTPISIDLKTGGPGEAWVEGRENAKVIAEEDGIESIVNLHPAFAFKRSDYRSKLAFASGYHISLTHGKMRLVDGKFQDFATQFEVPDTPQVWSLVRSVMVLALKSDPGKILQKQIGAYEAARKIHKPHFTCPTSFKVVASFFDDIFYPAIGGLRSPLRAFVRAAAQAHPSELARLKKYYRSDVQAQALERYLATFGDYFRMFDQFRQVLTHVRVGSEDVDDLIVGSKRFDEIKLYYGQAYETLTSSYTTLACLNNISAGRPFDEFKSMSLAKFVNDVDKAKRSNPFADEPTLSAFTRFENSGLRNGSHHASIWREGDFIKFRSGGTGAERDIAYSRYMHICNGITIAIAALLLVELEFFSDIALE